jgi:superfamily II DNA/RNA helicase
MLDSEFLPQIQEVLASCTFTSIQKAVFSATLPAGAEKIAMGMLTNPIRVVVGLKCVRFCGTRSCHSLILQNQRYAAPSDLSISYLCSGRPI